MGTRLLGIHTTIILNETLCTNSPDGGLYLNNYCIYEIVAKLILYIFVSLSAVILEPYVLSCVLKNLWCFTENNAY